MNPKKKNVLMICCDHWFADLMGCAGRHDIMTPTLDYLAEHGVRFDNCYSECPVCIPARRTMMTGLLPATHGDRVYSDRMPMPQVATLPQVFRDNGYQAYAVGKLHVFPQRDRIGFDDVILAEEGRYEFGVVDDYQAWLGENGYVGQEFMHGMGNNNYLTRPWHLDERAHPTTWVTTQMMKTIKRLDPTRPAFLYCSYAFPHPRWCRCSSSGICTTMRSCAPPRGRTGWMTAMCFRLCASRKSIIPKRKAPRPPCVLRPVHPHRLLDSFAHRNPA